MHIFSKFLSSFDWDPRSIIPCHLMKVWVDNMTVKFLESLNLNWILLIQYDSIVFVHWSMNI